jgi:hypothetical protein
MATAIRVSIVVLLHLYIYKHLNRVLIYTIIIQGSLFVSKRGLYIHACVSSRIAKAEPIKRQSPSCIGYSYRPLMPTFNDRHQLGIRREKYKSLTLRAAVYVCTQGRGDPFLINIDGLLSAYALAAISISRFNRIKTNNKKAFNFPFFFVLSIYLPPLTTLQISCPTYKRNYFFFLSFYKAHRSFFIVGWWLGTVVVYQQEHPGPSAFWI